MQACLTPSFLSLLHTHPVVCAQVVHLLLEDRDPELFADVLDDVQRVAQSWPVFSVPVAGTKSLPLKESPRSLLEACYAHLSTSCLPMRTPIASSAAAADGPAVCSLYLRVHSCKSRDMHGSATMRVSPVLKGLSWFILDGLAAMQVEPLYTAVGGGGVQPPVSQCSRLDELDRLQPCTLPLPLFLTHLCMLSS